MADENRLNSILCKFDADWMASDEARTEATNDLYFSRVSQWDDWLSNYTTLQYRGQFDVVRPVVRKLVAEMRRNPIDVLFRPKDGANPDAADVLMGMYRTDMRHNTAKIAVNVGVREQIESGVGAWRLVTQYEDNDPTSNRTITGGAAMNNLMTTKQVAEFCGVSISTVLRWNSVNRRTGQKYRPDFPDPDIKSCPNKWASRKIYRFAGVIE